MKLTTRVASALSFAHLAGIGRSKAQSDEDRREDAEDDAEEQDSEDGDSKKSKKAKRAEDEKDEDRADGDEDDAKAEGDEEDDEPKKGKRAKAESDDDEEDDDDKDKDDDEEEMRGKSAVARARRRERARCATIFASKVAARNPVLAASLAFNTALTRKQALAVLRDTPAPAANGDRSTRNPSLGAGGEQSANSPKALESRWDAAFSRVRGK